MSNSPLGTEYDSIENGSEHCPSDDGDEQFFDAPYEEEDEFEEQDYYDEQMNYYEDQGDEVQRYEENEDIDEDNQETEEQEEYEEAEQNEVEQMTIELGPDSLCPGGSKSPKESRKRQKLCKAMKNSINPNTLNYQRRNLFISYRFTCYECGTVFSSETQLKKHLRDTHKISNHRCFVPKCKQSFKRE